MSSREEVIKASKYLEQILSKLGIKQIVFVDDEYENNEADLEKVNDIIKQIEPKQLEQICSELKIVFHDDEEIMLKSISSEWDEWEKDKQEKFYNLISEEKRLEEDVVVDDPGDASLLADIMQDKNFLPISPIEWEQRGEELLEKAKSEPTLFLFDQEFKKSKTTIPNGITIIRDVLAKNDEIICALLTHTVTIENQIERWDAFAKEIEIKSDRFLVIPKEWMHKSPFDFIIMLKKTVLFPEYRIMKKKALQMLKESSQYAEDELNNITPLELDHMVFKVSNLEGNWEPDMLFRIYNLFHREKSREKAYTDGTLESIANKIREISHIPTDNIPLSTEMINSLQQKELYEDGEYINTLNLPIEIGDIFQKQGSTSTKYYMLIGQPCDLMVRSDGKRGSEDMLVPLIEIKPGKEEKVNKEFTREVPFFSKDSNTKYYAFLNIISYLELSNLDLCVFNKDGSASIDCGNDLDSNLIPSWKNRYAILKEKYKKCLDTIQLLAPVKNEPKEEADKKKKIIQKLFSPGPFKVEVDFPAKKISLNLKRVKRLNRERAYGLLIGFSSVASRPAYDRPFGVDDKCQEGCTT